MTNQQYEPYLRFAVTSLQNAQKHLKRIPSGDSQSGDALDNAIQGMDAAIWNIKWWADMNGIELRESMHT